MPLTDNQQALIVFISAVFIAIGGAAATIPNLFPDQYKYAIAAIFWVVGIIGLALKEALGTTQPSITSTPSTPSKLQTPTSTALARVLRAKATAFILEFAYNKSGMAGRRKRYYDPDPRARRHRSHRKGRVPPQLRAWVFGGRRHHRTADPRPRRRFYSRRRHYDPKARPRRSYRGYARAAGRKAEGLINRYGAWLGGLLAAVYGLWYGINEYNGNLSDYFTDIVGGKMSNGNVRGPEIGHLANFNQNDPWNAGNYLKYKFTGQDPYGNNPGSAWVVPFWGGLIAWLGASILKKITHKGSRILTPIAKLGKGATIVSAFGAVALPGSPPMDSKYTPSYAGAINAPKDIGLVQNVNYYR